MSSNKRIKMAKHTLSYFGIAGRAEPIRLAAVIGKFPFTNKSLGWKEFGEQKDKLPLGQVPILEIEQDGGTKTIIPQSDAILRYIGKQTGLYPEDPVEALQVDALLDTIKDLEMPLDVTFMGPVKFLFSDKDWEKEDKLAMRKRILEKAIPKYLGFVEKALKDNGTGWLVGKNVTIADLRLYYPCQIMIGNGILDGIPAETLDAYPNIQTCMTGIQKIPQVVAWYEKYPGAKYGNFDYVPKEE